MSNIGQAQAQAGLLGVMAPRMENGSVSGQEGERFDSVLKSIIAAKDIGGKGVIKGDKSNKAINRSASERVVAEKPDFLIMNNNIIKHTINDEGSKKEETKEASWMMSILISRFVTEEDIKSIIPEGEDDTSIDGQTVMANLEKLIEGKIAAGEIQTMGENGENIDPMVLLKELKAFFVKNNDADADGAKGISIGEFKSILSMARSMGMAKSDGETGVNLNHLSSEDEVKTDAKTVGDQLINKTAASAGSSDGSETIINTEATRRAAIVSENVKATVLPEENTQSKTSLKSAMQTHIADNRTVEQVPKTEHAQSTLLKNDPLLSAETEVVAEEEDAMVKDGGIKNAENISLKEKNSSNRINQELAGATVKSVTKGSMGDEKIEVRPSLRNETAANLDVFKVKNAENAGGNQANENALNLASQKNGTSFANKAGKEDAVTNFQAHLNDEGIIGKETVTTTTKEAPQTYDMRETKDVTRLMKTLEMMANTKGESKLTVTLTPENLGKLEIRLVEHAGKLTAKFFTDNEASHKMMISQGEAIRSQLLEKGIVIESMDFGFKDATAGRDGGENKRSSSSRSGRKGYKDDESQDDGRSIESVAERNSRNNAVYA